MNFLLPHDAGWLNLFGGFLPLLRTGMAFDRSRFERSYFLDFVSTRIGIHGPLIELSFLVSFKVLCRNTNSLHSSRVIHSRRNTILPFPSLVEIEMLTTVSTRSSKVVNNLLNFRYGEGTVRIICSSFLLVLEIIDRTIYPIGSFLSFWRLCQNLIFFTPVGF